MRFASLVASAALALLTLVAAPASAETTPSQPSTSSSTSVTPVPTAPQTKAAPSSTASQSTKPPPASASAPSSTSGPSTTSPPVPTQSQPQVQTQVHAASAPVNHNPYGSVSLSSTHGAITFTGYALDPSDLNAPVTAMFTINGQVSGWAIADKPSPQLYAYGVGAPSGLAGTMGTSLSGGTASVCMFLFNIGEGAHTLAQCTDLKIASQGPSGGVSATFGSNGDISVSAYAYDLNAPAASVGVWIVDNGVLKAARIANDPQPSLAPYGIPGVHGANLSYFAGVTGKHDICVYAINIGLGENQWIACTTVNVTANAGYHTPRGAFQLLESKGGINVMGWAYDGSDLNQSLSVMWTVDGVVKAYSAANLESGYLGLPGNHATLARIPASAGWHSVCMFVGNIGAGSSQLVQCENVNVQTGWVLPVDGSVYTSCYCQRWGTFHNGIDLAAPTGKPIKAAYDGVVTSAGPVNGYGNLIVIKHPASGIYTAYAHMYTIGVYVGQYVSAGQQIAPVGAYGNVTGPHLHMETWYGPALYQSRVDPAVWLAQQGVQLPAYAN